MKIDIAEIKQIMKQKSITQVMISQQTGIPIRTLNDIFRGKTTNPRIDTMQAILSAVGLEEEKPTLAQQVLDTTLANLDIDDYEKLTPAEQKQVADIFNKVVQAFKQK